MEMKRSDALDMLSREIAAMGHCAHCEVDHSDARLMERVRGDRETWPHYWRCSHNAFYEEINRLKALSLTEIGRDRPYVCQSCIDEPEDEDDRCDNLKKLRELAKRPDRNCRGLCLACAKADCINLGQYVCLQHARDF